MFKNLCKEDLPRERLMREGTEALSLTELIAILLTTGLKGKSVIELAQEMLLHFGGLNGLLDATIAELMEIKGIGHAKAIQLKAVFGIAQRAAKMGYSERISIRTPEQAYALIKDSIAHEKREVMIVLLRDVRGRMVQLEKVSIGTLSEVLVHPREVFYPAVRHKAHSFILAHNHPSGDPTPSSADLDLTRLLLKSSHVMGIALDDHLILGNNSFISLKQKGFLGPLTKY